MDINDSDPPTTKASPPVDESPDVSGIVSVVTIPAVQWHVFRCVLL